jgi:5'-nucleotidase
VSAPPAASAPVAFPRSHVVIAGETLWSLAKQYYGDPKQWVSIQAANPSIAQWGGLKTGTVLVIPEPGK